MNRFSSKLGDLRDLAVEVVRRDVAPRAGEVDQAARWPAHSMKAFAEAGLLGLQVPESLGGQGQGLLGLALVTEVVAQDCPSSALCFGMHCVGTAVIAAKATEYQQDTYLRRIARGEHITTLALSETGTGAHIYLPSTELRIQDKHFSVCGTKQFVTNGGHADSYVVSVASPTDLHESGDLSCVIVDGDSEGLTWLEAWQGFGMRGNSSRGMQLDNVSLDSRNLLGQVGDQVWYVFEVIVPYFLMAMAGTYLGIAESALRTASDHLKTRRYSHSGSTLANLDLLQSRYADMWLTVEKTRNFLYEAAQRGDMGHPEALPMLLASKADAVDTAVSVTNDAMTICGGMAYRENSRLAQMLRDARAGHVMGPTTDLLKLWTGRALLNLPVL